MDEELLRAMLDKLMEELKQEYDHRKIFQIRILLKELEKRGENGRQGRCNCC